MGSYDVRAALRLDNSYDVRAVEVWTHWRPGEWAWHRGHNRGVHVVWGGEAQCGMGSYDVRAALRLDSSYDVRAVEVL